MNQLQAQLAFPFLILLSGCQLFNSGKSDPTESTEPNQGQTSEAQADFESLPIELKQSKIWSRLDEIELEQQRQRARIKLIEKGLLLGVVPDELRDPADLEHERTQREKTKKKAEKPNVPEAPKTQVEPVAIVSPQPTQKSEDRAQFEKDLAIAQDYFRDGKYGKAIVGFEELGSKYSENLVGGQHHYWIGLCWYNLKDFEASQRNLQNLVTKNASSPWVPRAKLYLARIQIRSGLREQGLSALRKIIFDHANEDAAEMARADIESLKAEL